MHDPLGLLQTIRRPLPQRPLPPAIAITRPILRQIRGCIVHAILRRDRELNRTVALDERRRFRALGSIPRRNGHFASRDIESVDRPVDQFKRSQRLEERHEMSALIDAHEGEFPRLANHAVHDTVTRTDVREARAVVTARVHVVCHDLSAQPVAVEVRVAEVHGDADVLGQQFRHGLDGADLAVVVAGGGERVDHPGGGFRVVHVRADGGLDAFGVEVVDVVGLREGVGGEVADVVFVAGEVDVVDAFDFLIVENLRLVFRHCYVEGLRLLKARHTW